jgi:hypothetical protein
VTFVFRVDESPRAFHHRASNCVIVAADSSQARPAAHHDVMHPGRDRESAPDPPPPAIHIARTADDESA